MAPRPSRRRRPAPVVQPREPNIYQIHCAVTLAWVEAVARDVCSMNNPVAAQHGKDHAFFMAGIWAQRQIEYLKERLNMNMPPAMRPSEEALDKWEADNIFIEIDLELDGEYDVKLELWQAERRYIKLEVRGFPR